MARRGRRGNSPEQQRATGETRPSRKVVPLFPEHARIPDPSDMPPPADMSAEARALWREKVERYRQRGQKIDGFQAALRQYCEIEALLNAAWSTRLGPTAALVNCYRAWAAEFFDTPDASRGIAARNAGGPNRFGNNGRR